MDGLLIVYYNPITMFLFGACWGSFMNVVLYRYPLGLSVASPASACPSCKKPIPFYDNIPVLSWLILRGKCRNCKSSFSPRYALNEALYGAMWAAACLIYPEGGLLGLSLAVIVTTSIPAGWLLWRHRKAPWYLLSGFVLGVGIHLQQILAR